MRRFLVVLGLVAACDVVLTAPGGEPSPSHASALAAPRVDRMDDGRVIVSQVAAGDLAGMVTLTLHPAAKGSYVGEWAFMVAHADNTDPETGLEPPPHLHNTIPQPGERAAPPHEVGSHKDFVRYVHRGALFGIVTGASLAFDAHGGLTDISAKLAVDQGTQEFTGVSGTGHVSLNTIKLNVQAVRP